jgi:hypothetical protein
VAVGVEARCTWAVVLGILAILGCEGRRPQDVYLGLQRSDVDARLDAGPRDAGTVAATDAGVVTDAGLSDGGVVDAGTPGPDAGTMPPPDFSHAAVDAALLEACTAATGEDANVDAAIIVSLDGLKVAAVTNHPQRVPTLTALRTAGASTLDARTDPTWSITLPNHTGMITGRTVDGDDGHGVTGNGYSPVSIHDARGDYTHGIFDVAHDRGLFTVLAASKSKFERLQESYVAGAPDTIDDDNGANKIDAALAAEQPDATTLRRTLEAVSTLTNDPPRRALMFVHFKAADAAGHAYGFDATTSDTLYMVAVEEADLLLTNLITGVLTTNLCGRTSIFVVTDHGGRGFGHSDVREPENTMIPFFAYGPRALPGGDLVQLNEGVHAPIQNIDVGNLALHHLGLPAVPGSTQNADFSLRTR